MTRELAIPASIKEQFRAFVPYMVDFRPLLHADGRVGWEMTMVLPEDVLSGSLDEDFLSRNKLTVDGEREEQFDTDFSRVIIRPRNMRITLKYNCR
jgi:hypothetical protein